MPRDKFQPIRVHYFRVEWSNSIQKNVCEIVSRKMDAKVRETNDLFKFDS